MQVKFQNFRIIYVYHITDHTLISMPPLPPPLNIINFFIFFIKLKFSNKRRNMISNKELESEIIQGTFINRFINEFF